MLQRKTPLARGPGPTCKTGLCRESRTRRREKATQAAAYASAADAGQEWCSACGAAGHTDHAHLFTQGRWKAHRNTAQNWERLLSRVRFNVDSQQVPKEHSQRQTPTLRVSLR